MTDLGTTNANNTLNAWFRNTAFTTLTAAMAVSLHSGDPGTAGALEVGGSSYARQNVVFGIPDGVSVASTAALNFSGMPACTGSSAVAGMGIWCGSQFQQGGLLTGGAQAVSQGNTFTLSSLSCSVQ